PSIESSPAVPLTQTKSPEMPLIDALAETRRHEPEALAQTRKSKKAAHEAIETLDALGETRPHTPQEAVEYGLEPISPARAHLSFACLLIPRFENHHLTGDLATRLAEWVSSICVAYGWRLEYISIRPEYLQWVVSVPPSTSPGVLMRTIRMKTSEYIFTEFPRLRKENPSGDFWAPGYLIMGSNQPHPPQLVRSYILETRRHQGISRPPR
ncbi:MAG: transposase, partial [Anaerolineales bacterium]